MLIFYIIFISYNLLSNKKIKSKFILGIQNSFKFKTHIIIASHSKKFSSLVGPAIIPSGGFKVNSEKYIKRINIFYWSFGYKLLIYHKQKTFTIHPTNLQLFKPLAIISIN